VAALTAAFKASKEYLANSKRSTKTMDIKDKEEIISGKAIAHSSRKLPEGYRVRAILFFTPIIRKKRMLWKDQLTRYKNSHTTLYTNDFKNGFLKSLVYNYKTST
jgi:hypothetical protein